MDEIWKPVVGYEEFYEVSNLGRMRILVDRPYQGLKAGHIRNFPLKRGYPATNLFRDSKVKQCLVHCLVAEAFLGPRPDGMEINHKDGNKANNYIDNLEYVTKSQNALHAVHVLGVGPDNRGERHGMHKLTKDTIKKIRELCATGEYSYSQIGDMFKICPSAVCQIVKRKRWKHI